MSRRSPRRSTESGTLGGTMPRGRGVLPRPRADSSDISRAMPCGYPCSVHRQQQECAG
ncbi:unnamed protein product [Ectocarpus sp. CCAP 1310/34]|nr:unnamed protein product [Ectocarpus sp. CCAP 1310/34]